MTVAFGDHAAINLKSQGVGADIGGLCAQAHGAAQIRVGIAFFDAAIGILPLIDQGNHGVGAVGFEFSAVGIVQMGHMASKFNGRDLHP